MHTGLLGARMNYSCTPYLFDNVPRQNEIISFSESSATPYVNSVWGGAHQPRVRPERPVRGRGRQGAGIRPFIDRKPPGHGTGDC